MKFYIVTWNELVDRKVVFKSEIVKTEESADAKKMMQKYNAEKRLTTMEYNVVDLIALLDSKSLQISEKTTKL